MSAIVILFILYAIFGNRKNKFSIKQWSTLKKVIVGLIAISIFGDIIPGLFVFGLALSPVILPIIIGITMVNNTKKARKNMEETLNFYRGSFNQANDATGQYFGYAEKANKGRQIKTDGTILPKAASKRRAIIQKFNKTYDLYLTDSQIQRIVDASYYSVEWEKEVAAMNEDYNSIYEWFQGDTGWLRAYLKAFKVQSISSDFRQQEQICFSEFNQVFGGVKMDASIGYDHTISEMNQKFFTGFDDVSFMIAYRFLESRGKKYHLGNDTIVSADYELEELAKKYEQRPMY